jgi:transmembrane sensor
VRLDGAIVPRSHAIVANTAAWRQHRLIFDSAPLDEIVAEFNRYNQAVHMRLQGLEHDQHRFDGSFDATDPQSLIEMLAADPDLIVERNGADVVIRAH